MIRGVFPYYSYNKNNIYIYISNVNVNRDNSNVATTKVHNDHDSGDGVMMIFGSIVLVDRSIH